MPPEAQERRRVAAHGPQPLDPVPEGRDPGFNAVWHQCDGAWPVYPPHADRHRRGFWTEGHLPIRFVEEFCIFPDGPMQGEPARMPRWCQEATYEVYTLRADGLRQYRRILVGVAKKNAKTAWVAWLSLYHTYADAEPAPFNVCAAFGDDQADLLFGYAKATVKMAQEDDTLKALWADVEAFEREIIITSKPGAKLRRLASSGGRLDGPNLYFRAIDELHQWQTPKAQDTHTMLFQGGALRRQPLFFEITTAPWGHEESICLRRYEHGMQVETGEATDPTLLFIWYEGPRVDGAGEPYGLRDREAWWPANPGEGETVTHERFIEDLDDPEMTDAIARRFRFNQIVEAEDAWLAEGVWQTARADAPIQITGKLRTVAAIDASTKHDSTAIVWVEAEGYGDERSVRVRQRIWERPNGPDGKPIEGWKMPFHEHRWHAYSMHFGTEADGDWCEDGHCRCCGEAFEPLQLDVFGYDSSYFAQESQRWEQDGLPMDECAQWDSVMVPGTTAAEQMILTGNLRHDGDPVAARHIAGAVSKPALQQRGMRVKRRSGTIRRPNDFAIALVMCCYLLQKDEPEAAGETHIW